MSDSNPDPWEAEIEALIQELVEHERLSDELRDETEDLLEGGFYTSAGRLATLAVDDTGAHAD